MAWPTTTWRLGQAGQTMHRSKGRAVVMPLNVPTLIGRPTTRDGSDRIVVARWLGRVSSEFVDEGEDGAGGDGAGDGAVGGLDVEGAEAVVVGGVGRFAERADGFDLFVLGGGGGALGGVVDDDRAGCGLGDGVDVGG